MAKEKNIRKQSHKSQRLLKDQKLSLGTFKETAREKMIGQSYRLSI